MRTSTTLTTTSTIQSESGNLNKCMRHLMVGKKHTKNVGGLFYIRSSIECKSVVQSCTQHAQTHLPLATCVRVQRATITHIILLAHVGGVRVARAGAWARRVLNLHVNDARATPRSCMSVCVFVCSSCQYSHDTYNATTHLPARSGSGVVACRRPRRRHSTMQRLRACSRQFATSSLSLTSMRGRNVICLLKW